MKNCRFLRQYLSIYCFDYSTQIIGRRTFLNIDSTFCRKKNNFYLKIGNCRQIFANSMDVIISITHVDFQLTHALNVQVKNLVVNK